MQHRLSARKETSDIAQLVRPSPADDQVIVDCNTKWSSRLDNISGH